MATCVIFLILERCLWHHCSEAYMTDFKHWNRIIASDFDPFQGQQSLQASEKAEKALQERQELNRTALVILRNVPFLYRWSWLCDRVNLPVLSLLRFCEHANFVELDCNLSCVGLPEQLACIVSGCIILILEILETLLGQKIHLSAYSRECEKSRCRINPASSHLVLCLSLLSLHVPLSRSLQVRVSGIWSSSPIREFEAVWWLCSWMTAVSQGCFIV